MRYLTLIALLSLILLDAHADNLSADQDNLTDIVIFKGIDGRLSAQSRAGLALLRRAAREQGPITVWVSFDIPFQADPALRTAAVAEQEAAAKAEMIDSVIAPMSGLLTLLMTPAGLGGAPGCMVETTEQGLVELVQDERVKHISYHP